MNLKNAKFDFSESILTPKNQSKLPKNNLLDELLFISSTYDKEIICKF